MEMKISKHCLMQALTRTASIADKKSSMQILSNVLIEAGETENVRIAATDLNISASGVFPAQVLDGGAVTVPAKTFYDVIRNMPDGEIVIHHDGDQVFIKGGRSTFKLLSLPAEDFPVLPIADDADFFEMDAPLMSRMIEQTAFSISNDETRPHINGALFQGDGKNLRMVTTDGHRLSKTEVRIDESGFYNFAMIVPNKGILEIRKLVEDGDGVVSIAVHEGSVFLRRTVEVEKESEGIDPVLAEVVLITKLIEAEFPPYDQVIPKGNDLLAVASRQAFLDALRRVSVVSSDRSLGVTFKFAAGTLEIGSNNPSVGEGTEQLDLDYDGDEMEIGFNARYFIDILSVLQDDEVRIELAGPLDPVILRNPSGVFVGVVMPMRI